MVKIQNVSRETAIRTVRTCRVIVCIISTAAPRADMISDVDRSASMRSNLRQNVIMSGLTQDAKCISRHTEIMIVDILDFDIFQYYEQD